MDEFIAEARQYLEELHRKTMCKQKERYPRKPLLNADWCIERIQGGDGIRVCEKNWAAWQGQTFSCGFEASGHVSRMGCMPAPQVRDNRLTLDENGELDAASRSRLRQAYDEWRCIATQTTPG